MKKVNVRTTCPCGDPGGCRHRMFAAVGPDRGIEMRSGPALHQYPWRSVLRTRLCGGHGVRHQSSEKSDGDRHAACISGFHVRGVSVAACCISTEASSLCLCGRAVRDIRDRRASELSRLQR